MPLLSSLPAYQALREQQGQASHVHLRELFATDPQRPERFQAQGAGWTLDYSRQRLTPEALRLLLRLAEEAHVPQQRQAMFSGEKLNTTEGRAVLHTALRQPPSAEVWVDGENVVPEVHAVLERMSTLAEAVRQGRWLGHTGRPIKNIVNIGIGGSDLGPLMGSEALKAYSQRDLTLRFVSNIDASDLAEALYDLNPAETLFIVSSKTFTTQETMTNARSARAWLWQALPEQAVGRHFVAVSTNLRAAEAFGIDPAQVYGFWDWVGGRFSISSAIGLSLMISIGPAHFAEFLTGFHQMDQHFLEAPLERNLPVLLALFNLWNTHFLGAQSCAVLPYDQYLRHLPAYLQQLEMESGGKRVSLDGETLPYPSAPVLWGQAGTNGQHAFYQLLHQGTVLVPCEFIGFCQPLHGPAEHHDLLTANLFAQVQALAFGQSAEETLAAGVSPALVPHRTFPGNRPSSVLLSDRLTPRSLGALIALYEHKVFVQGVLWGINSFDQWGVELGKALAQRVLPAVQREEAVEQQDASLQPLLRRYWAGRKRG